MTQWMGFGEADENMRCSMWKNLKIRREAVPGNIRLFNLYAQEEITFKQLKETFMKRNCIEHLTDEDFINWCEGLGWKIRREKKVITIDTPVRCEDCVYAEVIDSKTGSLRCIRIFANCNKDDSCPYGGLKEK